MFRFFVRIVVALARWKYVGKTVVLQRHGVDHDVGEVTGVYSITTESDLRIVAVVASLKSSDSRLGFAIRQHTVDVLDIHWSKDRKQYVVRHHDPEA